MTAALSIRQPWAWLILHAGKDIENRDWATAFRGRVLIHAGKSMTRAEYEDGAETLRTCGSSGIVLPPFEELQRGGIVGSVEIVACTAESDSPWFFGKYGFVLRDPRPSTFVPWKGRLGFFNIPAGALDWKGGA